MVNDICSSTFFIHLLQFEEALIERHFEQAFDLMKGAPFSQLDLIKWRRKVRPGHLICDEYEEYEEGIKINPDLQRGLDAYYNLIIEKVVL